MTAPDKEAPRVFAVLNRNTFLRSLAAHLLLPAREVPEFPDPVTGVAESGLLVVRGALPKPLAEKMLDEETGQFPVLAELDEDHGLFPDDDSGRFAISPPLPLNGVRRAAFPDDKWLTEFESREFEDIDPSILENCADPDLFAGEAAATAEELLEEAKKAVDSAASPEVGLNDSVAGGVCCLMKMVPAESAWLESVVPSLLGLGEHRKDPLSFLVETLAPLVTGSDDCTREVLACAANVFSGIDSREGWAAVSAVEEIAGTLSDSSSCDSDQIGAWKEHCTDILENRIECESLNDTGNIALRAILLACLRRDPESVLNSDSSFLRAGAQVRALAGFLTGLCSGFSRLPGKLKSFKGSPAAGTLIRELLLSDPDGNAPVSTETGEAHAETEAGADLTKRFSIRRDNRIIYERVVRPPAIYTQLMGMSEQLNHPLAFDEKIGYLKFTTEWRNGRRQPVYIKILEPNEQRKEIIRFISPCESLPMLGKAKSRKAVMKALSESDAESVGRPNLLEMLLLQSTEEWHCRFVVDSEIRALCIAVDQLVETLDREELAHHLNHVARLADEFELRLGKDEYR